MIVAVVVVVEAAETETFGGSFLGQNFDICPVCSSSSVDVVPPPPPPSASLC